MNNSTRLTLRGWHGANQRQQHRAAEPAAAARGDDSPTNSEPALPVSTLRSGAAIALTAKSIKATLVLDHGFSPG
jgi:hypothetical protein